MIQRIHHINFIVRNLETAIPAWERILGRVMTSRDRLDERGVDIARFDLGHAWVVLVEPIRAGTAPAVHLERYGEGFFLLSLETDSLHTEVERLGETTFDGPVRAGLDDWQVRDVGIAGMFGVRVQLVESHDSG